MDHLHFSDLHQLPPPRIDYIVPPEESYYYAEPFAEFGQKAFQHMLPELQRFREHGSADTSVPTRLFIFCQEWFFFGVLVEIANVLQIQFNREDFIRQANDGGLVLTTQKLPEFMERTHKRTSGTVGKIRIVKDVLRRSQRGEQLMRGRSCLELASSRLISINYLSLDETNNLEYIRFRNIWQCCWILCESLWRVLQIHFTAQHMRSPLPSKPFLQKTYGARLRAGAHCPSRIKNLITGTMSDGYFASSLVDERQRDHSLCSMTSCEHSHALSGTGLPRHRPPHECGGWCKFITIEYWQYYTMQQILDTGSFPVLALQTDDFGMPISLQVADAKQHDLRYVAISHVWYVALLVRNSNIDQLQVPWTWEST